MEVAGCPAPSLAALWGSMNARLRLKKRYSCQSALQGPSDHGSEPYLTSLLRGRGESRDSIMSDQKQVSGLLASLTEGALVSAVTGGVFSPREQAHDPHRELQPAVHAEATPTSGARVPPSSREPSGVRSAADTWPPSSSRRIR